MDCDDDIVMMIDQEEDDLLNEAICCNKNFEQKDSGTECSAQTVISVEMPRPDKSIETNGFNNIQPKSSPKEKIILEAEENVVSHVKNNSSVVKRTQTDENENKKAHRNRKNSNSSSSTTSNNEKRAVEVETDPAVLARRQKDIDYGKNTIGYDTYIQMIPKEKRTVDHPRTPPMHTKYSRRGWDGMVKLWRKQLHLWDPPGESNTEAESKSTDS